VCSQYNDEFLAIVQSSSTYTTPTNISFDAQKNPVTVDSGFFTVCDDYPLNSHDNNCTAPPTNNNGTGFETAEDPGTPSGGSTGWLSTTVPINPGEDVTLRFAIFDEGDHILDSAVLIDNFSWGATAVSAPVTNPITKLIRHRRQRRPIAASSLMCGA
ncbi:MAG TPA: choice-of-anchor L domain-containing protein, partial [Polyangia bacterium]|nr:choice-of-anchor L domain-containing protein [Polyangia bacterium]